MMAASGTALSPKSWPLSFMVCSKTCFTLPISFDLNSSMKFSYLTSALYMNGAISDDGNLFWCTNTWWVVNRGASSTYSNYEYLAYTIHLRNGHAITPMIGAVHSWKFDQDMDVAAGFYYSFKDWNLYLWGNDILKSHPRIIAGIDFEL